jgi:hypothetical protein
MEKTFKEKILAELAKKRANFGGSDAKFATSIGISGSQYSRVKNGELDKVLSDAQWISLARQSGVQLNNSQNWKTAETPVFTFVTAQLEMCQRDGISSLLCDAADIGKTYTARHYARNHKNAIYVDCSQVKSKQKLIRFISRQFGVGHLGKYNDVYEDLVFYLRSIESPLVILDEAGDLDYAAFLELKALWNATEFTCGWYMMGADGLKEKVRRAIECKKVGYTEIFSRYGKNYGHVMPESADEREQLSKAQAAMIIKINAPAGTNIQQLVQKTDGSLRRCYIEIMKMNASNLQ